MNKQPLEIEYKFLIAYPDIAVLSSQPEYRCEELCQTYLTLPDGQNCRIRSVKHDSTIRYIKTFKESITDMTRIEIESEITEEEFLKLKKYAKSGRRPIEKVRHSFELFGFTYEVDVFPFWQDRAFLEVEVESEEVKPPIPNFIKVIKDISTDLRYRNSALAKKIITEPLI